MALLQSLRVVVGRALPGLLGPRGAGAAAGWARRKRPFSAARDDPDSLGTLSAEDFDDFDDDDDDVDEDDDDGDVEYEDDDEGEGEEGEEGEEEEQTPDGRQYAYLRDREPQPDLVDKYLAVQNASLEEQRKAERKQVRESFQRFPGDVGSTEVQVASLSTRIAHLSEHLQFHRKDKSSRRGLEGLLNQRRQLLEYLRREDFDRYATTIYRLDLKDNYAERTRFDKSNYETLRPVKARMKDAMKRQQQKLKQQQKPARKRR